MLRWGLIASILFVALWWVVEDPIAHVYYQAHQAQLSLDFRARRFTAHPGQALATIQIPSVGINTVVAEGDSVNGLRSGPGHDRVTPLPGARGNSVVFGHRSGWGGPFGGLAKVRPGDAILVETRNRSVYEYVVKSTKDFGAADARPFASSNDYRITLVTGAGGRFDDQRLVVSAVSGPPGKLAVPGRDIGTGIPSGSDSWGGTLGAFLLRLLLTVGAWVALRRWYSRRVALFVVVPLAVASALALFFVLDGLLSPLG